MVDAVGLQAAVGCLQGPAGPKPAGVCAVSAARLRSESFAWPGSPWRWTAITDEMGTESCAPQSARVHARAAVQGNIKFYRQKVPAAEQDAGGQSAKEGKEEL